MRLQIKHTAFLFILSIIIVFSGCAEKPDVLYINGKIYTMGKENKVAEAVAVKDGKILETGSTSDLSDKYKPEETIDLKGAKQHLKTYYQKEEIENIKLNQSKETAAFRTGSEMSLFEPPAGDLSDPEMVTKNPKLKDDLIQLRTFLTNLLKDIS